MRIVFIISQLTNGGAEREVAAFANELVKMGEEVHIVCIHDVADDYAVDERVHRHWLRTSAISARRLKKICTPLLMAVQLRKIHGDAILSFYVPHDYYFRLFLATAFSKTRLIYTVRCNPEKEIPDRRDRRRKDLACRAADGVWIQTEAQRQFFPRSMQKKLFIVHNILDPRFLEIERITPKKIIHFISVGRLHPQKNQKLLVEAFARLIQKTGNQSATLTIYGQSRKNYRQTEEELKERIRSLQLEDRVFLPGRVKDIEKKYEEADAFVFGSDYEGMPNALMEAMASGLPCISTDCATGPSALITTGEDGLLVPVGDVEAMAQAMEYLIRYPQQANRLGQAARLRMREWGTAEGQTESLLEHLHRICF